jgi:4-oxalocrotonate tautomerase
MPLIQVSLIEGRSREQHQALARALTQACVETLGAPAQTVRVIVTDIPAARWFVGGEPSVPRSSSGQP